MKKLPFYLAIGLMLSIGYSCDNVSLETRDDNESTHEVEEMHEDHDTDAIQLNNGEKWEVNDEMRPFIKNGANLVSAFLNNPIKDENAYKVLAMQLKEQDDKLISSCTMKGESHEELHKWLHPHLGLVKSLETAIDLNVAEKIVIDIKNSYNNYEKYFK